MSRLLTNLPSDVNHFFSHLLGNLPVIARYNVDLSAEGWSIFNEYSHSAFDFSLSENQLPESSSNTAENP